MLPDKNNFTSLELVELINQFRVEEGNKSPLLHKNLMAVIREEFEDENGQLEIQPSTYTNSQNKEQPMYILNLHQSRQVLVRESKFVRRAVIAYIDKLERVILPQDYPSALRALADQAEQNQRLILENKVQSQQIAELQPKASYYDLVLQCNSLISMTEIAKDYGMSAKGMNKLLHEEGVQYNQSGVWFLYAKHQNCGYTQTKTQNYNRPDGSQGTRPHTYWTQKGRLFLYDLLKSKGIVPMIEKD